MLWVYCVYCVCVVCVCSSESGSESVVAVMGRRLFYTIIAKMNIFEIAVGILLHKDRHTVYTSDVCGCSVGFQFSLSRLAGFQVFWEQ